MNKSERDFDVTHLQRAAGEKLGVNVEAKQGLSEATNMGKAAGALFKGLDIGKNKVSKDQMEEVMVQRSKGSGRKYDFKNKTMIRAIEMDPQAIQAKLKQPNTRNDDNASRKENKDEHNDNVRKNRI